MTKEEVLTLRYRDTIHRGRCRKIIGKRGGIKEKIERWRINGKIKLWKTKPDAFEVSIKYGMRECSYLNDFNCEEFHLEKDCPLLTKSNEEDNAFQSEDKS